MNIKKLLEKPFFNHWDEFCTQPNIQPWSGGSGSLRADQMDSKKVSTFCFCPISAVYFKLTGDYARTSDVDEEIMLACDLTREEGNLIIRAADWKDGGESWQIEEFTPIRERLLRPILKAKGMRGLQ